MNCLKGKKIIGLTGQTGAGKSTVSAFFQEHGFHIINADYVARVIVEQGSPCLQELVEYYSPSILQADGTLNRPALAAIAFSDMEHTEALNRIMYPYITGYILNEIRNTDSSVPILLDAPTLFESQLHLFCTTVVAVVADSAVRLQRIMERDHISESAAKQRMQVQHTEDFFREHADFVLENHTTLQALQKQIQAIQKDIL